MLPLALRHRSAAPLSILCLGAHADDIEIGCGGTLLALLRHYPRVHLRWVVFSASAKRAEEARASARTFLALAEGGEVKTHDIRDGFFPAEFARLKELFEDLKLDFAPDLVFTHFRGDAHQDHRTVAELTLSTFRDHLVLEYEVPKYDPDLGNPNIFVPLRSEHAEAKVAGLMRHFATQTSRRWFQAEVFYSLMRLRGIQAAAASGLAEGFYGPKLALQLEP